MKREGSYESILRKWRQLVLNGTVDGSSVSKSRQTTISNRVVLLLGEVSLFQARNLGWKGKIGIYLLVACKLLQSDMNSIEVHLYALSVFVDVLGRMVSARLVTQEATFEFRDRFN